MKAKQLLLIAVAAISSISFIACSSDDDETPPTPKTPAEALAGTWKGTVTGDDAKTDNNAVLIITANANGTIELIQPSFTLKNSNSPTTGAVVHKVEIEETENGYKFYHKYISNAGGASVVGEVWGTVQGNEITFDYIWNHTGTDYLLHFKGKK